jgi:hypothetical protein
MGHDSLRRPPKYTHGFIDRHGKARWYFRRSAYKRVPLPGLPWSREFMEKYEAALAGAAPVVIGIRRTMPGTIEDAVARCLGSVTVAGLAPTGSAWLKRRQRSSDREHRLANLEARFANSWKFVRYFKGAVKALVTAMVSNPLRARIGDFPWGSTKVLTISPRYPSRPRHRQLRRAVWT